MFTQPFTRIRQFNIHIVDPNPNPNPDTLRDEHDGSGVYCYLRSQALQALTEFVELGKV